MLVRIDAGVELCGVEPQLCSVAFEIGLAKLRGIAEQPVVIGPEFSLLRGARGRLGRRSRARVVGQRVMTIDEPDLVAVGLEHLVHGRRRAQAVRTLEIGKLDDFDRRIRRPLGGAAVGGDRLARRIQEHADRRLRLERSHVLLADFAHAFLRQKLADRLTDLLERCALHARPIGLVPEGDVIVRDRTDLRRDFPLDERRPADPFRLRGAVHQRCRDELVERGTAGLVQRDSQLHAAEVGGRLLQRLVVDLGQCDRSRSDGRHDIGRRQPLGLLRRGR